jgi:hypothetical protein
MQGRSLLPILSGARSPEHHRSFVRSEYYDSERSSNNTRATMYLEGDWKLVVYHNSEIGELYNLAEDPWEYDNLWNRSDHKEKRWELLKKSFDASMVNMDPGPPRTMSY